MSQISHKSCIYFALTLRRIFFFSFCHSEHKRTIEANICHWSIASDEWEEKETRKLINNTLYTSAAVQPLFEFFWLRRRFFCFHVQWSGTFNTRHVRRTRNSTTALKLNEKLLLAIKKWIRLWIFLLLLFQFNGNKDELNKKHVVVGNCRKLMSKKCSLGWKSIKTQIIKSDMSSSLLLSSNTIWCSVEPSVERDLLFRMRTHLIYSRPKRTAADEMPCQKVNAMAKKCILSASNEMTSRQTAITITRTNKRAFDWLESPLLPNGFHCVLAAQQ